MLTYEQETGYMHVAFGKATGWSTTIIQLRVGKKIVNDWKYEYPGFATQLHKYFKLSIHFKLTTDRH